MGIYQVNSNGVLVKKQGTQKKPFRAFGSTLYMAHCTSPGYIERCITSGIQHQQSTLFRTVLMFEGYKGSDLLNCPAWNLVLHALQLGRKYDVGVTVEIGSALISYLERQGEDPYLEKWDDLFFRVLRKAARMYKNQSHIFCFTLINEFLPYNKNQEQFDLVFRRMKLCSEVLQKFAGKKVPLASGGLLHLTQKSGGRPRPVTCEWVENGTKRIPYWQGVYSCPGVSINMIHIYSNTIEKINNNQTEWSNLDEYHDFCKNLKRVIIVDEFGMKLPLINTTEIGLSYLEAVDKQLASLDNKKPPVIEYWNLEPTCHGFGWWPESQVFGPIFAKMRAMQEVHFPFKRNGGYQVKQFQLDTIQKSIDGEEFQYDYKFAAKRTQMVFIYNKTYAQKIPILEAYHGIVAKVLGTFEANSYSISLRFYLGLEERATKKKFYAIQSWGSGRQNQLIPTSDQNKVFGDMLYGDFAELGRKGEKRTKYDLFSLKIQMICYSCPNPCFGTIKINNIAFASK